MTSTHVRRDSNDHTPINLSSSNQDMNQIPSVNSASAVTVASVQAALSALQAGQVSLNQLSTLNAQNALWQNQVAVVAADSVTSQNLQGSQLPVSHSDLHSLQAALQQQHFNLQHQLQSFLINQVQIPGQFASIYPNRPMISHQIRSTFPALRENTMDPLSSQRTETESSTITQHFLQMPIISNQNYQRGFYDHMHSRATPSDFLNSHIAENNFEMEQFAKEFKRRRNLLGFTQGDVGLALGKTYGSYFSQTTISRFEAHNLSHKNMSNLKPLLQKWLKDAEVCNTTAVNVCTPTPEIVDLSGKRRKKRTSIKNVIRTSLEFAFRRNSMPGSEEIRRIANNLSLDKEVIRVWFCNRRQKEKYISAGSASGKTGSPRTTSPDLNVEDSEDIVISLK